VAKFTDDDAGDLRPSSSAQVWVSEINAGLTARCTPATLLG